MDDNDKLYLKHFALARSGVGLTPNSDFGEYQERTDGPTRSGESTKWVTYNNSELLALAIGVADGRSDKAPPMMWAKANLANFIKKQLGEG